MTSRSGKADNKHRYLQPPFSRFLARFETILRVAAFGQSGPGMCGEFGLCSIPGGVPFRIRSSGPGCLAAAPSQLPVPGLADGRAPLESAQLRSRGIQSFQSGGGLVRGLETTQASSCLRRCLLFSLAGFKGNLALL